MKNKVNSALQAMENWEEGIDLSDAWFHLASPENQNRFRLSDQITRSPNGVEISLRIDLHARIESGELQAFGIESGQHAHSGPKPIGRHFFHKYAAIDWGNSSLKSHDISFFSVRVIRKIYWDFGERDYSGNNLDDSKKISYSPEPKVELSLKKIGRPSSITMIRHVIHKLNETNIWEGKLAKEVESNIRFACKERYPRFFSAPGSPSRRTINRALKAEGLSRIV